MLTRFYLTATLSTAISLFPNIAFSNPVTINTQYQQTYKPNIDLPVCYIQIENGQTIDLNKLCSPNSVNATNTNSSETKLGAGNCYLFDANGKPCVLTASDQKPSTLQQNSN